MSKTFQPELLIESTRMDHLEVRPFGQLRYSSLLSRCGRGIPHLAKDERDVGHPGFVVRTNNKSSAYSCV
jgi:hypothetical protein